MPTFEVSLESGAIDLVINTGTGHATITNTATRDGVFNVFNAAVLSGQPIASVIVWSYTQPAGTSATIPIPSIDNNGNAIIWQVGNVTNKGGQVVQTVISPPWQLTMA